MLNTQDVWSPWSQKKKKSENKKRKLWQYIAYRKFFLFLFLFIHICEHWFWWITKNKKKTVFREKSSHMQHKQKATIKMPKNFHWFFFFFFSFLSFLMIFFWCIFYYDYYYRLCYVSNQTLFSALSEYVRKNKIRRSIQNDK